VDPRVVALGGGHGLAATLSALRALTPLITAIVTVADNGGSSGRLRQEFPILPPGDLRMALASLCADDEWGRGWANILQHRFTSTGELGGHTVGNLLLAALWDRESDPVVGLDQVASLLKVVGRVLPMSSGPLDIEATFVEGLDSKIVRGQVQVATSPGRLETLRILPENPPSRPEAIAAIEAADWITMGPGSWFSSVLPHLLVPEQQRAIIASRAKKILILNLDAGVQISGNEFAGHSSEEHVNLIHKYAPDLRVDYVLADVSVRADSSGLQKLESKIASLGGKLVVRDLRIEPSSVHHDVTKLTHSLGNIMTDSLIG